MTKSPEGNPYALYTEVDSENKEEKGDEDVIENNSLFKVLRKHMRDEESGKIIHSTGFVIVKNYSLFASLQSYSISIMNFGKTQVWGKQRWICHLSQVYSVYEVMKKGENHSSETKKFLKFMDKEFAAFKKKADKSIKEGKISFDALWYLLPKKLEAFSFWKEDQVLGGNIHNISYGLNQKRELVFNVELETIKSDGHHFFRYIYRNSINSFPTFKLIKHLDIQPITKEVKEVLVKRGKLFSKMGLGHHLMQYNKFMIYEKPWGTTMFKADGRVMVDIKTFQRMNPAYSEFIDDTPKTENDVDENNVFAWLSRMRGQQNAIKYGEAEEGANGMREIPEEILHQCWPTVAGFSFNSKKWGELLLSQLTDVVYDDDAFDKLVLPSDKKGLVEAIVKQHQYYKSRFNDVITGKGGGRIFLLHGPPGVGKTLTAEAIAERLHEPLYSVSVGELGTTSIQLEAKLQEILEVSSIWNAVILIDEADIFLEQRGNKDIMRNAMVGVFLRLLEYHQGVLFLTTNRVSRFDEAFNSRISVALKYDQLDSDARTIIWRNFLNMLNENNDNEDLAKRLSTWDLNGRQIRTAMQLSQALAESEERPIDFEHVTRTLDISAQFEKKDITRSEVQRIVERIGSK